MVKRATTTKATKPKRDPIVTNQIERARELKRLNGREKQLQRGLRKLRAEMQKTDRAQRDFYEWLGQRFELDDVRIAAEAAEGK